MDAGRPLDELYETIESLVDEMRGRGDEIEDDELRGLFARVHSYLEVERDVLAELGARPGEAGDPIAALELQNATMQHDLRRIEASGSGARERLDRLKERVEQYFQDSGRWGFRRWLAEGLAGPGARPLMEMLRRKLRGPHSQR